MTVFLSRFKRECFASLFMLAICVSMQGQNLVPNPGFEEYSTCPDTFSQLPEAFPWILPGLGTADLFNICGTCTPDWSIVCVPNNWAGYQFPHSGNGYAGIFITNSDNYREYIQTVLQSPMVAGDTYSVSFYVSLADKEKYGTNNIGAYFSEIPISSDDDENFDCCSPQITASNVITSKTDWTLISGCYLASGNEQYITIGN